ncbi:MAG TPA: DUF2332 domain-containing protein [Homoserinimonas sp.]|nr:DUF2332 domain-containing protein [Homoserinimonas sp.]
MKRSTDPSVTTAERYRAFAEVEARGMSDCYEEWAAGVARDDAVLALIDRLPAPKRQPNLVFSAARYLGAPVTGYTEFARWLLDQWDDVAAVCLSHATQTNEPGRCATLLPALAAIPGPLALIEVGASAGLCLYPDRYSYRYRLPGGQDDRTLDPDAGPSPVVLDCELTGNVPVPGRMPEVVWRAGVDLNPLDAGRAEDVAWLDALIWPEHHDRRARLHAAVEVVKDDPVELVRGDLVAEIEALVGRAPVGASVVVFHTAVLAYLDDSARKDFVDIMDRLPVSWLANEGTGVVPGVLDRVKAGNAQPTATSDFVLSLDGEPIAFTQPHGRALHWLG